MCMHHVDNIKDCRNSQLLVSENTDILYACVVALSTSLELRMLSSHGTDGLLAAHYIHSSSASALFSLLTYVQSLSEHKCHCGLSIKVGSRPGQNEALNVMHRRTIVPH